jgi:hypothetical protein
LKLLLNRNGDYGQILNQKNQILWEKIHKLKRVETEKWELEKTMKTNERALKVIV